MEDGKRLVDVLIPTYKPGKRFGQLLDRLYRQKYPINQLIIINTEQAFWNPQWEAGRENMQVHHIDKADFDHGGTRRLGVSYASGDIFVWMTQDALPKDLDMLGNLIRPLEIEGVAASYARQIPSINAHCIEAFTRSFNYPPKSSITWKRDLKKRGIKTYFCSDVCAAYNREIYLQQGGFIPRAIFNEDMIFGAGLIQAGYGIAYAADAHVIHSHNYNCWQQLQRNFDLGVSQAEHPEIFESVPSEGAGIALVGASLRYLLRERKPWLIPKLVVHSGFKYMGYQMGKHYERLPKKWIKVCTMTPNYWE